MTIFDARNVDDLQAASSRNGNRHTHSLATLFNVAKTAPASGAFLYFDGTSKLWDSKALALTDLPAIALNDLSDAVISSPATAQFIRYNGTNWVNAVASYGDISAVAWQAYTPTVKLGATTVSIASDSAFLQIGKLLVVNIAFRFTNLNAGTGNLTVTLPGSRRSITNPANSYINTPGGANLFDISVTAVYGFTASFNNNNDLVFRRYGATGDTVVTHANPVTIAAGISGTGDEFYATVTYESA